jgi:tetratricopeptide (TPR) repeat protein
MMDLRMTCLDRRLSELDTVVEVLGGGDPDVVEHADDVLRGLGSLARCADADALQSSVPPPVDPDTRAALEGVRAALDRATILGSAGRFDDALDLAQRTAAGVDALGYRPITAEVEVVLGGAFENAADYDAAEEHLERALLAALASGHDEIAVEAAANLVRVVGSRLSRHEEGLRWSRQARSLAERVGGGPDHEINLLTSVASVHDDAARYHKASALRTKAIELIRSQGELDVLQLARTEAALAGTYQSMGRFDEAREILERALGEAEAILGPDHPQLRTFLNPLGIVLDDQGRYDEAIAVYERARKICESSLPAGHPGGATVLTNLGVTLLHVGRSEEALRVQEQALRMLEGALGAETPRVAAALNNVASIHIERRELELAREYIERAVEIWTKVYGPDHPRVAEGLVNLGGVSYGLRDNDAARRHLQRAIEIDEASLGPKHPALLKPLTQLALLDQREDRIAPFLMDTSRMIPLTLHAEPQDAAYAYYRHADALWENGRNAEAYMFALAARTIWASGGDRYRAQVEDVDKWMSNDWDKLPAAPRKSPQPG